LARGAADGETERIIMANSPATKRPAASKRPAAKRAPAATAGPARPRASRMHDVPNLVTEDEFEQLPDQPFAESSVDAVDPDLRHRLVSEAAYQRYVDRGYADGYDLDDWLQAEAAIDHLLVNRKPE
jgi:predicted acyl esterase